MTASVLVLDKVTKRFGDFTAVDQLSFAVPEGGVFGFLGGQRGGQDHLACAWPWTSIPTAFRRPHRGASAVRRRARTPRRRSAFPPEERGPVPAG